jgi:predicted nucleotidyltransferase
MIDILPEHLQIVLKILSAYAPECEVRAFGSRYAHKAKSYSDLDLVLVAEEKLDWRKLARIQEAFQESILPYRVDVLDWRAISPSFQKAIEERGYEALQKPTLVLTEN